RALQKLNHNHALPAAQGHNSPSNSAGGLAPARSADNLYQAFVHHFAPLAFLCMNRAHNSTVSLRLQIFSIKSHLNRLIVPALQLADGHLVGHPLLAFRIAELLSVLPALDPSPDAHPG